MECNNYRLISLTLTSEILAKLFHKCLFRFVDQNEILYNNQYGFKNNHSATHRLIDATEKIRNAQDNNHECGLFIDLLKNV